MMQTNNLPNPQWIVALLGILGLAGSALWMVVNLRIENRLLERIDGLKDWADARFMRQMDAPCQVQRVVKIRNAGAD
ncbi:MAG: hypothetical protein ABSF62_02530 [Bryobacteraceae bacterium]|jgi:hypothetical protein